MTTNSRFPAPVKTPSTRQHEVADPGRAAALFETLSASPGDLTELCGKHITSIKHFTPQEILELIRLAAGYEAGLLECPCLPQGMVLSNMFLDYTRPQIRLSFDRAWLKMGGSVMNIERTIQELMANRTEAYQEVAELCNITSDLAIILTQKDGVLEEMLKYISVPVINAGNGSGEHPSHALADLYTLFKWRPDLLATDPADPLRITVVGDPSYVRTIRSFLFGLTKFPQIVDRLVILEQILRPFQPGQREELEAAGLTIEVAAELFPHESASGIEKHILPDSDVIYVHELAPKQVRRMSLIESAALLKPNAMVLNPEIQIQEYANLINDSAHNGYFAQARGATHVRTALLAAVMGLY